jgi:hypothetical protein
MVDTRPGNCWHPLPAFTLDMWGAARNGLLESASNILRPRWSWR